INKLYPDILKLVDMDDWFNATPLINQLYEIDKNYQNIESLYEEAKVKNSADYYLGKADKAKREKKIDLAISFYDIAMKYPEDQVRVRELYIKSLAEFAELFFQTGIDFAQQDFVWQAYDNIRKAYDVINKIPVEKRRLVNIPKKELSRYYDNLYLKAKKSEDAGKLGLTYLYYRLLFNLNPTYPDIKENIKKLENKILNRAVKSLAVIPFKSPKNAPDAGGLFTSNIMLSLYNELKDDLKIIERESTDILLKEFELNLAAQSSQKTAGLKIVSADYFLLGDVLDYKVESSTQEGKKSVRVKTRTDIVTNPEYEEWFRLYGKMQQEGNGVPTPPSKTIEKPVFEDVKYAIKYFKKVAVISISYRIVDVNGKLIHTGIVDIKKDAVDEASEGVEIGDFKIPFKVAQLPTDTELLKKAQDEAINKIKSETKNIFKNSEEKYISQAKEYEKDNNIVEAIERYVDGILIMKRKKIPSEKIEESIIKYLDSIVNM
ncbi:MAG: CsgG/HfaB family protein, partial [Deferribacterales bacterium]